MPPLTERLRDRGLTSTAPLGGAVGIHPHDPTTGAFSLVVKSLEEHAPTGIVNGPRQHRAGQSFDVQVFDRDHAEAVHQGASPSRVVPGALFG